MNTASAKVVWTMGLVGISAAALADAANTAPPRPSAPGAGRIRHGGSDRRIRGGTGGRGHRRGPRYLAGAAGAPRRRGGQSAGPSGGAREPMRRSDLAETNRALTARLDELAQRVETAQTPSGGAAAHEEAAGREDAAKVLDGLQGDVLFRTGSAEITAETAHEIEVLAGAVAKSPALKVRVDGYADPRGTVDANLKLSEARADAVRDLFLAAGVSDEALEVNAYGKSQSVAAGQRRLCAGAPRAVDAASRGARSGRAVERGAAGFRGRAAGRYRPNERKRVTPGGPALRRCRAALVSAARSHAYDSAWPTIRRSCCWIACKPANPRIPRPRRSWPEFRAPASRINTPTPRSSSSAGCGPVPAANGACATPNMSSAC